MKKKNKVNSYFLGICDMPGTGLDNLHMCSYVFFTKHLCRYYYIYFVEKEIELIQLDWLVLFPLYSHSPNLF